jgi:hypothetical protein
LSSNRGNLDDGVVKVFISAMDLAISKHLGGGGGGGGKSSVTGLLLILNHITSNLTIQLPISSITRHVKEEHGMIVAVDGAHVLWSLPLDVGACHAHGNNLYGYRG